MSKLRTERRLGVTAAPARALKTLLLFAVLGLAAFAIAYLGRKPDLAHVRAAILSGPVSGNYYAVVQKVAEEVRRRHGRIENVPSAGSIDNIGRLLTARTSGCKPQFALVQDGMTWPADDVFELVGRLPRPESFVLVGRDADAIRRVQDFRGKRIGIGPVGSGTTHVAQLVLTQLPGLGIVASNHNTDDQLAMVERGELDLAAMVIDADAQILVTAIRDRNLQLVDMPGAEALAHRLPFAQVGRIEAGHYDPIRQLPATDRAVIQVDTLLIGNGCARGSVTQGVITAFGQVFPTFVRLNRERPNLTGLHFAPTAESYYHDGSPDAVGEHVPWVVDIMPTARWLQLAFGLSMLFAAQALLHRFRLWRIDALRVQIENEIARFFPAGVTVSDIPHLTGAAGVATDAGVDTLIERLSKLSRRCRRQSLSMMVPMGQEMAYRYQESLIADLLHALKEWRRRAVT